MEDNKEIDLEYQPKTQNNQEEQQDEKLQEQKNLGACPLFNVEYYQPYFNVTNDQVKQRVLSVFLPKIDFFELIGNTPDMWGPFWVCTTLIFLLASMGNIQTFLQTESVHSFKINYEYLEYAAIIVYLYGFGNPALVGITMKCLGAQISITKMICLYGYSLIPYIPVVILCILPFQIIQWLLLIYATINTTYFILKNLYMELSKFESNKKYFLIAIIVLFHLIFFIIFKFYFFRMVTNDDVDAKSVSDDVGGE